MLAGITRRAVHAYRIVIEPIWSWIFLLGVGVLLGLYQGTISLVVAPDKRGPYDVWNLMPHLPWGSWVIIGAVVTILILMEGSYRVFDSIDKKQNELRADFSDETSANVNARLANLDVRHRKVLFDLMTAKITPPNVHVESTIVLQSAGFMTHGLGGLEFNERYRSLVTQWFKQNPP